MPLLGIDSCQTGLLHLSVARGASCFIFLIPLYDGLEPAELACVDHFILIGAFFTFLQPGAQLEKETRWLEVKAERRCYTEI